MKLNTRTINRYWSLGAL